MLGFLDDLKELKTSWEVVKHFLDKASDKIYLNPEESCDILRGLVRDFPAACKALALSLSLPREILREAVMEKPELLEFVESLRRYDILAKDLECVIKENKRMETWSHATKEFLRISDTSVVRLTLFRGHRQILVLTDKLTNMAALALVILSDLDEIDIDEEDEIKQLMHILNRIQEAVRKMKGKLRGKNDNIRHGLYL